MGKRVISTARSIRKFGWILALGIVASPAPGQHVAPRDRGDDCIIENVTVLTMAHRAKPLRLQTVIVENGRITAIGPSGRVRRPKGIRRIDGRGKWLMPSLTDMHVHITDPAMFAQNAGEAPAVGMSDADIMLPFAANGVLQVFNLSSSPASLRQTAAVESGEIFGPRQALAFMIDGKPPMNGGGMAESVGTPEEGRAAVRKAHIAGYQAIKTYSALDFDTFQAIREEAIGLGMKVLGHIPLRNMDRTSELLSPGFSMVVHSEEYAYQSPSVSPAAIPKFVELARDRDVWLTTTLVLNERVVERTIAPRRLFERKELRYTHPAIVALWRDRNHYASSQDRLPRRQAVVDFNPKLLRAFHAAGIKLVTGTDTGVAGIMPGFGLLDELERLARIGIPNADVLAASTRIPAEFLGVIGDRGTVEVGKRADLILLAGDPTASISNVRRLAAVISSGRVYPQSELASMMEDLARRYAGAGEMKVSAADAAGLGEFGHDDE